MIAAASGQSVAGVLAHTTGPEYAGWIRYLRRYPPDGAQYLLAQIVQILFAVHSKKGARLPRLRDIAPWLDDRPASKPKDSMQRHLDSIRDMVEARG